MYYLQLTLYLALGEHIDYALFGVFPAAIDRDILVAVAPNDEDSGRVVAENLDGKYTRQTFAPTRDSLMDWDLDIDKTQLRWESYVKAGYHVRSVWTCLNVRGSHYSDL